MVFSGLGWVIVVSRDSFKYWWMGVHDLASTNELYLVVQVYYQIWCRRNELLFDKKEWNWATISCRAKSMHAKFHQLHLVDTEAGVESLILLVNMWVSPLEGLIKMNADA